jgi:hypothetical protein
LQVNISKTTGQPVFVKIDSLKMLRDAKAKSKAEKNMKSHLRTNAEFEVPISMQYLKKTTNDVLESIIPETPKENQRE